MAANIDVFTDQNWQREVLGSERPVLVDFWAEWCGPCKMMAPELSRVAAKNAGHFVVAKVNTEGLPLLAQRFNISTIPTLVLFNGGRERGRSQGARPVAEIHRFVEQTLRAA
jgi:thioredoxin